VGRSRSTGGVSCLIDPEKSSLFAQNQKHIFGCQFLTNWATVATPRFCRRPLPRSSHPRVKCFAPSRGASSRSSSVDATGCQHSPTEHRNTSPLMPSSVAALLDSEVTTRCAVTRSERTRNKRQRAFRARRRTLSRASPLHASGVQLSVLPTARRLEQPQLTRRCTGLRPSV
jgi:hypothetical protein